MLGIGIFIGPPAVAKSIEDPLSFLLLWLAGGIVALCGALSVAELGVMYPRCGGDYVFLRQSFGSGPAFAVGWLQLLAIFPGSLAAITLAIATFQLPALFGDAVTSPISVGGLEIPTTPIWAAAIVIVFTAINHVGIAASGRVQTVITGLPLVILGITSIYVLLGHGNGFELSAGAPGVSNVAVAYLPVYFAYAGWNAVIYIAGEVEKPERNLPRALAGGTLIVTLLYVVLCAGFLSVYSIPQLASVGEAGSAVAQEIFGATGVLAITFLIFFAMLGSSNGTVLAGSRIAYAMAQEGECIAPAARLHPRFKTPVFALWAQAAIAILLMATQRVDELLSYTSTAMLIAGVLTVMSVVVLRFKQPDIERPYRTFLYPLPPLLYSVSSVFVLAVIIWQGDRSVLLAVVWFVGALVAHRLLQRSSKFRGEPAAAGSSTEV